MDALSKIQVGGDKVNTKLASKGFREYTIQLITPAVNNPILGEDGPDIPTSVLLTPSPQCQKVSLKYQLVTGGALEVGDIYVTYITRSAEFEALITDPKTVWLITGPDVHGEFSVVGGTLNRTNAFWTAVLRKVQ